MIGAFARMLGAKEKLLAVEETEEQGYATRAQEPGRPAERKESRDAPPEAFVERVQDEGGDVYIAPMLEALRDWVRRRKGLPAADTEPARAGTPEGTLPRSSENP